MRAELAAPTGALRMLAALLLCRDAIAVPVHSRGRAAVEVSGAGEAVLAPEPMGPHIWELDGVNATNLDFSDLERRNWITEAIFGCPPPPPPPPSLPPPP